ncbi:MAG: hypothetical protein U0556_08385 [Dehalococcoidia bacterium]
MANRQQEAEEGFQTNPSVKVREELLRWFTAPAAQAPDRERIPIELLADSAINESNWSFRPKIIRAIGKAAVDNPADRAALVAVLEAMTSDRTVLERDRLVVVEVLDEVRRAVG